MSPWVGFDFDKTLATYDISYDIEQVGEPIKPTVDRLKKYLAKGYDVRIFTARISSGKDNRNPKFIKSIIEEWCVKHIGRKLPVTNIKDHGLLIFYDDKCVQVEPNTGRIFGDLSKEEELLGI